MYKFTITLGLMIALGGLMIALGAVIELYRSVGQQKEQRKNLAGAEVTSQRLGQQDDHSERSNIPTASIQRDLTMTINKRLDELKTKWDKASAPTRGKPLLLEWEETERIVIARFAIDLRDLLWRALSRIYNKICDKIGLLQNWFSGSEN